MAVFYSFHYQRDAARVQQIMQMGVIEGQPLLNSQEWEEVENQGEDAIKTWIDDKMKYKTAVVVLVGAETANRKWVEYEITKAWEEKRPLVGIRINGLAPLNLSQDPQGANPFASLTFEGGGSVADYVTLHAPTGSTSGDVYASIKNNLDTWVANAYKRP